MIVELNLRPDKRQLRQFGWIALTAFGVIGSVVLFRGGLLGLSFGANTSGPLAPDTIEDAASQDADALAA